MGAIDVVLYAEGAREDSTSYAFPSAPGELMQSEEHGPAHRMIRRAISVAKNNPEDAVQFVAPLRGKSGRRLRGSMLYSGSHIRRVLAAHDIQSKPPDLVVILVDQDGQPDRAKHFSDVATDILIPVVVGIAVPEFESWLIADSTALDNVVGAAKKPHGPPESLAPGEAKRVLLERLDGADEANTRTTLANTCDLDALRTSCPSFGQLFDALSAF